MSEMRFERRAVCTVHGHDDDDLVMLLFQDAREEERGICADCVAGLANELALPMYALNNYIEKWASFNLGTPMTLVMPDDGD